MIQANNAIQHEYFSFLDRHDRNKVIALGTRKSITKGEEEYLLTILDTLSRMKPGSKQMYIPSALDADEDGYVTVETIYLGEV